MKKSNEINYNEEYLMIASDILNNEEFIKRKSYKHHGNISVYDHSLKVSQLAYKISKKFKSMDRKSIIIGGLLHDFYYKSWMDNKEKKSFFKKHGFVHAKEALENSKNIFPLYMNNIVEDIIIKHMFPLNIKPPRYKEAWLVSLVDKWVSLEVLLEPDFFKKLFSIKK